MKLNISSGGIYVNRVRIFQECVAGYNVSNVRIVRACSKQGREKLTEGGG